MDTADDAADSSTRSHVGLDNSSVLGNYANIILVCLILYGMVFYHLEEGWSWVDAFYFSCVTVTTAGYGDIAPRTRAGKLFTVFFILLGVTLGATCLGVLIGRLQATMEHVDVPWQHRPSRVSRHWRELKSAVTTLFVVIGVGAAYATIYEGWSLVDSLYWAVVTCSSVGYGDFTIVTEHGRFLAATYLLFSIGSAGVCFGKIVHVFTDVEMERHITEFVTQGVTADMIKELQISADGSVDKLEFFQYMLVKMGKIGKEDIDRIEAVFSEFDANRNGFIDMKDIQAQRKQTGDRRTPSAIRAMAGGRGSIVQRMWARVVCGGRRRARQTSGP